MLRYTEKDRVYTVGKQLTWGDSTPQLSLTYWKNSKGDSCYSRATGAIWTDSGPGGPA